MNKVTFAAEVHTPRSTAIESLGCLVKACVKALKLILLFMYFMLYHN